MLEYSEEQNGKEQKLILQRLQVVGVAVDDSAEVNLKDDPRAIPVFLECLDIHDYSVNLIQEIAVQLAGPGRRTDVSAALVSFYKTLLQESSFQLSDLRFTVIQTICQVLTRAVAPDLIAVLQGAPLRDIELRFALAALKIADEAQIGGILLSAMTSHRSSEESLFGALIGTTGRSRKIYGEAVAALIARDSPELARRAKQTLMSLRESEN